MPRLRPAPEKPVPALTPEKMLFEQSDPNAPKTPVETPEPEIEVKPPEPPAKAEEPPVTEDNQSELLKQVEALRRSERLAKDQNARLARERDEAVVQSRSREEEVAKFRKESAQSQLDMVATALAAATSDAESAERELQTALESNDYGRAAQAQRRIAKAEANIARLEDGKAQLEVQVKAVPERPAVQQQQNNQLPPSAMEFLRKHNLEHNQPMLHKLGVLHQYLVEVEGMEAFSPEYFDEIETRANLRPKVETVDDTDDEPAPPSRRRPANVSAPVSREAPSTPGKPRGGGIKLTPEQREAAKNSGITETEYARQLERISKMRANGEYGDQR